MVQAENTLLNIIDITETMTLNMGFCLSNKAPPIVDMQHLSKICQMIHKSGVMCKNAGYLELLKQDKISIMSFSKLRKL